MSGEIRVRRTPLRLMRAATLSFVVAVAFTEIGHAVLFAEAWRSGSTNGGLAFDEVERLDRALHGVQSLQFLVVAAAVLGAFMWSVLVGWYAARSGKSARTALGVAVSWVLGASAMIALAHVPQPDGFEEMWMVMLPLKALAIFVPFAVLGAATARAGSGRVGFFNTYLAIALAFVVHEIVVARTDIGITATSEMLRPALLAFVNGLIVGVAMLFAADATRSVHSRTVDGARHRFHLDAREAARFHRPESVASRADAGMRG